MFFLFIYPLLPDIFIDRSVYYSVKLPAEIQAEYN